MIITKIIKFTKRKLKKFFFRSNIDLQEEIKDLNDKIEGLRLENLYLTIMRYFDNHDKSLYLNEIKYLEKKGELDVFPYEYMKRFEDSEVFYDKIEKLNYVLHENKKLYFPIELSVEDIKWSYANYIENENLLGGNYKEKNPHQYITDRFFVDKDDVILDLGSAEALFALHHVDTAKFIIIVENNPLWSKALEATFRPYKNKVKIINKIVSNFKSDESITLDEIMNEFPKAKFFIKMDLEGVEKDILQSNTLTFSKYPSFKIACATYHNNDDAQIIEQILKDYGFNIEFSEGYLLFLYDEFELKPPYFRKGILRASKIN
jgi:hypothetical protein